jgi:protein-disulfide isomerase
MKKVLASTLFLSLILAPSLPVLRAADAPDTSAVIAKVGDQNLTEDQMRKDLGNSLFQAENNVYNVKKSWIDKKTKDILFDQAAKKAGLSRKDWENQQMGSKLTPPTPPEIDQIIQRMVPAGQQPTDPTKVAELKKQAADYLLNQKKTQAENQLYQTVSAGQPIQILLVKPEAPHIEITYGEKNPVKGPKNAAVTVVEFTDFQCPWCKKSQENVQAVEKTYGDKIKFVDRMFPLSMHPHAMPAAEAAFCAKEQGKYWDFRDKLFQSSPQLEEADFKRIAKEVGLKEKKFDACLASHKYAADVQADIADGTRYGVQGTPSFFVDGVQTNFPQLEDAVKDALSKKKG